MSLGMEFSPTLMTEVLATINFGDTSLGCTNTAMAANSSSQSFWASVWGAANNWQTLIATGLAMLPASAAAIFVWKQLNEQRIQFLQIQTKDAQKSRLRLSRNLAGISSFLDNYYINLIKDNFSADNHTVCEKLVEDILDAGGHLR